MGTGGGKWDGVWSGGRGRLGGEEAAAARGGARGLRQGAEGWIGRCEVENGRGVYEGWRGCRGMYRMSSREEPAEEPWARCVVVCVGGAGAAV